MKTKNECHFMPIYKNFTQDNDLNAKGKIINIDKKIKRNVLIT